MSESEKQLQMLLNSMYRIITEFDAPTYPFQTLDEVSSFLGSSSMDWEGDFKTLDSIYRIYRGLEGYDSYVLSGEWLGAAAALCETKSYVNAAEYKTVPDQIQKRISDLVVERESRLIYEINELNVVEFNSRGIQIRNNYDLELADYLETIELLGNSRQLLKEFTVGIRDLVTNCWSGHIETRHLELKWTAGDQKSIKHFCENVSKVAEFLAPHFSSEQFVEIWSRILQDQLKDEENTAVKELEVHLLQLGILAPFAFPLITQESKMKTNKVEELIRLKESIAPGLVEVSAGTTKGGILGLLDNNLDFESGEMKQGKEQIDSAFLVPKMRISPLAYALSEIESDLITLYCSISQNSGMVTFNDCLYLANLISAKNPSQVGLLYDFGRSALLTELHDTEQLIRNLINADLRKGIKEAIKTVQGKVSEWHLVASKECFFHCLGILVDSVIESLFKNHIDELWSRQCWNMLQLFPGMFIYGKEKATIQKYSVRWDTYEKGRKCLEKFDVLELRRLIV